MTKTFLEKKYEKAVIHSICTSSATEADKQKMLLEFHHNCEEYYASLCDSLYAISTGQDIKPIWITPSGNCYLSLTRLHNGDRILIYADEVPPFNLDLIDQLELSLSRLLS